jgi:glycine C-acetyltransferase/8-amino-7-oxononanoate synthase
VESDWLQELTHLEGLDLRRSLQTLASCDGAIVRMEDGTPLINFASNDYLDLARDPLLRDAAQQAVGEFGVGSGSSRLICGTTGPHVGLEEALAAFKGTETALTFSSGYAAAMGLGTAIFDKDTVVVMDKLCHASLIDACRLSGATLRVFRHNDLEKLEALLAWARGKFSPDVSIVVITESVFSMDGDCAPLADMVALKERYGASMVVDEAHAIGILGEGGRGLASKLGLTDRIEIHMGTMSKSLGVSGGYLAGSVGLRDRLINKARSFIYSTAPPPAMAATAAVALRHLQGLLGDERRTRLWALVELMAQGLDLPTPQSAILPMTVGGASAALVLAAQLREAGFFVPAIRYPTVARGQARLRFTVTAGQSQAQVDELVVAVLRCRQLAQAPPHDWT